MFAISHSITASGLQFQRKPNHCTTFLLLIKVIFSFGIAYKKSEQIRRQWTAAFKRTSHAPCNQTQEQSNRSSITSSSIATIANDEVSQKESQVGFIERPLTQYTYEDWATKICQKGFSALKLDERITKAIKLTDCLLSEPEDFSLFKNLKNKVIEKRGSSQVPFYLRKKVFKLLFTAISELQRDSDSRSEHNNNNLGLRTLEMQPSMKQLFFKVFQFKQSNKTTNHFAFLGPYFEGGHNKVFLALDLDRAKKRIFRLLQNATDEKKEYLRKENEIHAKLLKDEELRCSVIKMYQTFYSNPFYGSILEYADVGCLSDILGTPELSNKDKKDLVELIVGFLQKMHEKGFVYGDLKSENIFIKSSKKGESKLKFGDFGGTYHLNEPGPRTTSPAIVPPESYRFIQTNQATDCWALGILLYEIKYCQRINEEIFRQVPEFIEHALEKVHYFKSKSTLLEVENAICIIRDALRSPEQFVDTSDPYDQLILALLQFKPEDRIDVGAAYRQLAKIPESSYSSSALMQHQRLFKSFHCNPRCPVYKLSGRIKTF